MAATRIVSMLINESVDVITHGIAAAADIDTAMRLGTPYPRGPLAWRDEPGATFVTSVPEFAGALRRRALSRVAFAQKPEH